MKYIKKFLRIVFTYVKYKKNIKGIGIIIKKSQIIGTTGSFYSNSFINKSVIKESVSIHEYTIVNNSILSGFNRIGKNCKIGNSFIDMYSYINDNSMVNNVEIGKFCSIGPDFKVGYGKHPVNFLSTSPLFYNNSPWLGVVLSNGNFFEEHSTTYIGNDVWIGANVFLSEGIIIGDGAIIGAGAIVTKDVPNYAIVGGAPAKIIRFRFSEKVIKLLLLLKWWDKKIDWLKINQDFFQKAIIEETDFSDLINSKS